MYQVPGLSQTLQLTSYTACLAMTGQVTNWDDPVFHENGANAGVSLPDLPIVPVTESDPEGINLTMEQYCIDEQPAIWAQYAQNMEALGVPPSGVPISATTAGANWEAPGNGYDEQSTSAIASNVASEGGAIGFVEENYAADEGFSGSNPAQGSRRSRMRVVISHCQRLWMQHLLWPTRPHGLMVWSSSISMDSVRTSTTRRRSRICSHQQRDGRHPRAPQ